MKDVPIRTYRGRTGDDLLTCVSNATTLAERWRVIGANGLGQYNRAQRDIFLKLSRELMLATEPNAKLLESK